VYRCCTLFATGKFERRPSASTLPLLTQSKFISELRVFHSPVPLQRWTHSDGRNSSNQIELSLSKPGKIILAQSAVAKQLYKHDRQNGVAVVVSSVDLVPTLRQGFASMIADG